MQTFIDSLCHCRNYFFNPDYSDAAPPPSAPADQSSTNPFPNLLDIGAAANDEVLLDIGGGDEDTADIDPALQGGEIQCTKQY